MNGNKPKEPKEGVSIKEIEAFTKKYRLEVILCGAFFLACLFSFVMWGAGKSVLGATIGAFIGILLLGKVEQYSKKAVYFIFTQENTTRLILAIVFLLLSIFVPPLYFFILGLIGGSHMYRMCTEIQTKKPN